MTDRNEEEWPAEFEAQAQQSSQESNDEQSSHPGALRSGASGSLTLLPNPSEMHRYQQYPSDPSNTPNYQNEGRNISFEASTSAQPQTSSSEPEASSSSSSATPTTSTLQELLSQIQEVVREDGNGIEFLCPWEGCGATRFVTRWNCSQHVKLKHFAEPQASHSCQGCGNTYIYKRDLSRHLNHKHPNHFCPECDKGGYELKDVRAHWKREHNGLKLPEYLENL